VKASSTSILGPLSPSRHNARLIRWVDRQPI
jgi:hypothetical protein